MSPIATSSCPMFSVNFRVEPQHAIQSQSIMCAFSGTVGQIICFFVSQTLPLSTLASNRSTFFRFPSNTHLISASHLFSSHNEKTCTCHTLSVCVRECLAGSSSKLSHLSFAFTMAMMQLYLKLPCVSFSFETLAHKAVTKSDIERNVMSETKPVQWL